MAAVLLLAAFVAACGSVEQPSQAAAGSLASPAASVDVFPTAGLSASAGLSPSAALSPTSSPTPDCTASRRPITEAPPSAPPADAAPPAIALRDVAAGLLLPVGLATARDGTGRLFVVLQNGQIRILAGDGNLLEMPFLDTTQRVLAGGERGLLGLAFHPQYACNGRFFVDYTDLDGNTVVAEFRASSSDPNRADPDPVAILLQIAQPYPNHNGGGLAFGPDGLLYIGMGDGGSANDPEGNGQRLDTLLGKLLRIDVDRRADGRPYAVPPGNCAGCPPGTAPEVFAYGLRNPWRFSFDSVPGDLWIGDVGQNRYEEVDRVALAAASGANFGWSRMEAGHCLGSRSCDRVGLTLPVAEYSHATGDCSVIGGSVYHGSAVPSLSGWYLYADYCSGRIRGLRTVEGSAPVLILESGRHLATFGADEAGELYVADPSRGTVSRIVAAP